MAIKPSEHLNEYQLVTAVRPDTTRAPTGMTVPANTPKFCLNDFGDKVVPQSFNYLTPTSGVNVRGETTVTLDTTVGSCRNVVKVSDRTAGAYEWSTTLSDGTPVTVSWLVNGRGNDSGNGAALQMGEYMFEKYDSEHVHPPGAVFHNPTRDGDTSVATPAIAADPNQTLNGHSGKPIYFSAAGSTFETCVAPLDFTFPVSGGPPEDWRGFEHGEDGVTTSAWWYGMRHYEKTELNWNGLANVHKRTFWTYMPTAFAKASMPNLLGRFTAHYAKALYFTDGGFIDLNNMSSFVCSGFTPTPGVNKFRNWTMNQNGVMDDNGVQDGSIPPTFYGRPASRYSAAVLNRPADDFCIAMATRMSANMVDDPLSINAKMIEGDASSMHITSFVGAAATGAITEPYAILFDPGSTSDRRAAGWIGHVEYIVIGRLADVLTQLSALKTGGHLDVAPTTNLPAAVTAGTVWPPPKRPSAHSNEWARYTAVGITGNTVATKLTLVPEDAGKHFINPHGQQVFPPSEYIYPTVGVGKTNETQHAVSTAQGYLNDVQIGNRTVGPLYWTTTCPNGFSLQWVVPFVWPTGVAFGFDEARIERLDQPDAIFHNPTMGGAGASPQVPPFNRLLMTDATKFRQLGSPLTYARVDGTGWEACVMPLEFGGSGVGPVNTQEGADSQDHGQRDEDTPPITAAWYGEREHSRCQLNWRGSGVCHRLDWWTHVPTEWSDEAGNGSSWECINWISAIASFKGRYFDRARVFDLANGTATGGTDIANFAATPGQPLFASWGFTRQRDTKAETLPAGPGYSIPATRSPYCAIVLSNTNDDFSIAWAVKLKDLDDDVDTELSKVADQPSRIEVGQFVNTTETGNDPLEITSCFFQVQAKGRQRRRGWNGYTVFQFAGLTDDVLAGLDELMLRGDLDVGPGNFVPQEVRRDTNPWNHGPVLTAGSIREMVRESMSGGRP